MITATALTWRAPRPGARPEAEVVELSATVGAGEVVDVSRMGNPSAVLRLLATLLRPRSGQLAVAGVDAIREPLAARRHLSYISPATPLPEGLTTGEYVTSLARSRGQAPSRATESIERFSLDARRRLSRLDAGEQQRARLAAAASTGADVLLLDQPFEALDAGARSVALEWLRDLRGAGAAVVVRVAAGELAGLSARELMPPAEHVA